MPPWQQLLIDLHPIIAPPPSASSSSSSAVATTLPSNDLILDHVQRCSQNKMARATNSTDCSLDAKGTLPAQISTLDPIEAPTSTNDDAASQENLERRNHHGTSNVGISELSMDATTSRGAAAPVMAQAVARENSDMSMSPAATSSGSTTVNAKTALLQAKVKLKKALLAKRAALERQKQPTNEPPSTRLAPISALRDAAALDSLVITNLQGSGPPDKVWFDTTTLTSLMASVNDVRVVPSGESSTNSVGSTTPPSPVPSTSSTTGVVVDAEPQQSQMGTKRQLEDKLRQAVAKKQRLETVKERKEQLLAVQQRKQQLEERARRLQERKDGSGGAEMAALSMNGDVTNRASNDTVAAPAAAETVSANARQSNTSSPTNSQFSDADEIFFDVTPTNGAVSSGADLKTCASTNTEMSGTNELKVAAPQAKEASAKPTRAELLVRKKEAELNREIMRFKSIAAKQERLLAHQTKQVRETTDRLTLVTQSLSHSQSELQITQQIIHEEMRRKTVLDELMAERVSQLVELRKKLHDATMVDNKADDTNAGDKNAGNHDDGMDDNNEDSAEQ
jgi:hypothetical protein